MNLLRTSILAAALLFSAVAAAATVNVKVIALFTDKAMLQVGDKQKIVKKGETFEGVRLESASGRAAIVVIDGQTHKLGLNRSQAIGGNYKKPNRSAMTIYPDSLGMFYVKGQINGQATNFLVDTGASFVTLSGRKARDLKIDFRKHGVVGRAQTAASVVQTWQIRLDSVSIGGIRATNVEAIVIPGNSPPEVLLGNSFLRHTKIEKAGATLEIQQRF